MTKFNIKQDKETDEKYYYAGIFDKSEEKLIKVCEKLGKEGFTIDFYEQDNHPTRTWITGYSVWVMANSRDFKNKTEFMSYLGKKLLRAKHDVHFNID